MSIKYNTLEEKVAKEQIVVDDDSPAERIWRINTLKGPIELSESQINHIADVHRRIEYAKDMKDSYKHGCDLTDADIVDIYDDYVYEDENDNVSWRIPLEKAIDKWLEENEREERVPNPVYKK